MSAVVVLAHNRRQANQFMSANHPGVRYVPVSESTHLLGLNVREILQTPEFATDTSVQASALRSSASVRAVPGVTAPAPTQKPTVGRMVHYQSFGTPGGEYLPEPRAAIITEADLVVKVVPNRPDGSVVYSPNDPAPKVIPTGEYRVSLAVINPTGIHFNQGPNGEGIPYADTPTPGHWNWPPRT